VVKDSQGVDSIRRGVLVEECEERGVLSFMSTEIGSSRKTLEKADVASGEGGIHNFIGDQVPAM